ncbi:MAG: HD domain-containing protein [Patescibacteria group bacterium]
MMLDEQKLISIAKPYFDKCRAGDWEHALRVAGWVKELGKNRADLSLLVTAAYLHDIGWSGVAPQGNLALEKILKLEAKANANSVKFVTQVMKAYGFGDADILTVSRLIKAADAHKSKAADEEILVDADSLSQLCKEHVIEKYKPESYIKIVNLWESEFKTKIKTKPARKIYPNLLIKLKNDLGQEIN